MRNVTWVVTAGLVARVLAGGTANAQPTTPQPQPPPAPQPAPQPQPDPQPPQPYPQQPQPYPQQPQPYPQPPQPYPQQPQPYPQQPHPTYYGPQYNLGGGPLVPPGTQVKSRRHDGAVILDFAVAGTLASTAIIARQDVDNGSAATFIVLAGIAGGGGLGWLLTEKYEVDAGTSHATTIGLLAGIANGALLVEPFGADDADGVLALLFVGSAVGAGAGFIYGQAADLTPGQSLFIANALLLGSATAALTAIAGSDDDEYGTFENGTLALGIDGGLIAGALIAPRLDWSPRRSRIVFAATAIGALAGGMIAGLAFDKDDGPDGERNGEFVAGCMTAGLWGGFGLGILMTRDSLPDPAFGPQPASKVTPRPGPAPTAPTSFAPFIGAQGQLGLMAGGAW